MATRKVTREGAFLLLRNASQNSNCKLSELASRVVDIGELDVPVRIGGRASERATEVNERGAVASERGAAMNDRDAALMSGASA